MYKHVASERQKSFHFDASVINRNFRINKNNPKILKINTKIIVNSKSDNSNSRPRHHPPHQMIKAKYHYKTVT